MSRTPPPSAADASLSPFAPLRQAAFRMLWGVWLTANLCMWMSDVAAAWMMTALTASPLWVALVQSAAMLPVFLLGLPSGALADSVDRRRYLIFTQLWACIAALALWLAVASDVLDPVVLLLLTFANGIALALRWPAISASVPELVPRAQLPAALALNGVAMNMTRIGGPLIAGLLIATLGTAWVFALNALLSILAAIALLRWRRVHRPDPMGREPIGRAMRVGIGFVRHSPPARAVLARVSVFFFHSSALVALLPLLARDLHADGATAYALLLSAMGAGAIGVALVLPRLRQHFGRDQLVMGGAVLHAAMTVVVVYAGELFLALLGMALAGAAYIVVANALSVSLQLSLPDWVRARAMSIYQMGMMGATAGGAAAWGQVASSAGLDAGLLYGSVSAVLAMAATVRLVRERDAVKAPVARALGGQVVQRVAYRVDHVQAQAFLALMEESRRSRLRQGAVGWALLQDLSEPGNYVEQITDASWSDHQRRRGRASLGDAALNERRQAFLLEGEEDESSQVMQTVG